MPPLSLSDPSFGTPEWAQGEVIATLKAQDNFNMPFTTVSFLGGWVVMCLFLVAAICGYSFNSLW